jgi:hypothetical protein
MLLCDGLLGANSRSADEYCAGPIGAVMTRDGGPGGNLALGGVLGWVW